MYVIKLNEEEMQTLLNLIKNDFEYSYNDGDEPNVQYMQEDADLLIATEKAFNNENAKLKLQTIIADYEKRIKDASKWI